MGHGEEQDATTQEALGWLNDVYKYALARLGSREDAEDATMEAYLALHSDPRRWVAARNRRLYLFGIAARKVADVLRKRRKHGALADAAGLPLKAEAERTDEIDAVLARMSDSQREVLILKYVCEFSTDEIALIAHRSPQAVNSLLQRARESFRIEGAESFGEGLPRWMR